MKESYFKQLKYVALDRLYPDRLNVLFLGTLIFSGVVTLVSRKPIKGNLVNMEWDRFLQFEIIALVIQAIIFVFFLKKDYPCKFQKIQLIFATIIVLKLSLETYLGFFLLCRTRWLPDYMVNMGFLFLIGGFVFLLLSTVRAIFRVKNGHLKEDGNGLYDFQQSVGYVSLPIIFGVVTVGTVLYKNISAFSDYGGAVYFLGIGVVLQYAIAMAIPEFFLLIYCKFKFPSFKVEPLKYED